MTALVLGIPRVTGQPLGSFNGPEPGGPEPMIGK